jgi:hypothetical protein
MDLSVSLGRVASGEAAVRGHVLVPIDEAMVILGLLALLADGADPGGDVAALADRASSRLQARMAEQDSAAS